MKIYVTSVFVDDQDKAEKFYTEVLGFTVKNNIPLGDNRKHWFPMASLHTLFRCKTLTRSGKGWAIWA